MLQLTWLFVGMVALLAAVGGMQRFDIWTRIIMMGLSMVTWLVWAFGAYNVEVVSGGQTTAHEYPQLAYLGFVLSAVTLAVLLRMAFDAIRDSTPGESGRPMGGI